MNILTTEITTPWGVTIDCFYRRDKSDFNTLISCLQEDEYEVGKLEDIGIAIDLGAHIGAVSIALASRGFTVKAVEMLPENVAMLKINTTNNGYDDKLLVFEGAVTADSAPVEAFYRKTNSETGSAHEYIGTIVPNNKAFPEYFDGKEIKVQGFTLSEIIGEDTIKFLKSDIEGAEWCVFSSTPQEVLNKIKIISCELHATSDKSVTTKEFLDILGSNFEDMSEEKFGELSKEGLLVHGYFINKL